MKYLIVASKFNEELVQGLIDSTINSLKDSGIKRDNIDIVRVPGAYEIPQAIAIMQKDLNLDSIHSAIPSTQRIYIALGVVIEGETSHANMIIEATGNALLDISLNQGLIIINEIVGAPSYKHAKVRCLGNEGTRGWYAGKAAVEFLQEINKFAN